VSSNPFLDAVERSKAGLKAAASEGLRAKLQRKVGPSCADLLREAYIHATPVSLLDIALGRLPQALSTHEHVLCVLATKNSKQKWFATTRGSGAGASYIVAVLDGTPWYVWNCDNTEEDRLCALIWF
jgi:hypothetical protein